jgi:putative alpha-1,2-mannosidase
MLGFYPRAGFSDYFVGTPRFSRVTLALPQSQSTLKVTASNVSDEAFYVHECMLDSQAVDMKTRPYLQHAQLMVGHELHFEMASQPN